MFRKEALKNCTFTLLHKLYTGRITTYEYYTTMAMLVRSLEGIE
jgi:hypothetical protein